MGRGRPRRNRLRYRGLTRSRRENVRHPNGEKGKKADHEDIISFRDGRFISEGCVKYGFEEKTFTATADGDAIRFLAENVSPKLGIMLWEGNVKGDDIEATSTWIRDRWYWKIKKEYWYRGKLKE